MSIIKIDQEKFVRLVKEVYESTLVDEPEEDDPLVVRGDEIFFNVFKEGFDLATAMLADCIVADE